jgi:hypothetical protein
MNPLGHPCILHEKSIKKAPNGIKRARAPSGMEFSFLEDCYFRVTFPFCVEEVNLTVLFCSTLSTDNTELFAVWAKKRGSEGFCVGKISSAHALLTV